MGFISKWVARMVRKENEKEKYISSNEVIKANPVEEYGMALNISVTNVTGGKIVSFRSYNRINDRQSNTTYIIHPDEEFTSSLARLIALEEVKM